MQSERAVDDFSFGQEHPHELRCLDFVEWVNLISAQHCVHGHHALSLLRYDNVAQLGSLDPSTKHIGTQVETAPFDYVCTATFA